MRPSGEKRHIGAERVFGLFEGDLDPGQAEVPESRQQIWPRHPQDMGF